MSRAGARSSSLDDSFVALPTELLLLVIHKLDDGALDRLALACCCTSLARLPIGTWTVTVRERTPVEVREQQWPAHVSNHAFCCDVAGIKPGTLGAFIKVVGYAYRTDDKPICAAPLSQRRRGHLAPMHTINIDEGRADTAFGGARFGKLRHEEARTLHRVSPPSACRYALLGVDLPCDAPQPFTALCVKRMRCVTISVHDTLVGLDLRKLGHLEAFSSTAMPHLARVGLPSSIRLLDLSDCAHLTQLDLSDGGTPRLACLRLYQCKRVSGSALCGLDVGSLEELDISWCEALDEASVAHVLSRCAALQTCSLRGLPVGLAIDALASAHETLTALDLGFTYGVTADEPLRGLVRACAALTRCSLRGAKRVSGDLYNEIVQLMQERSGQPEHAHSAFYYLKR